MIRHATAEDAPAVREIINKVVRETTITFNTVEKTPEDILAMIDVYGLNDAVVARNPVPSVDARTM